MVDKSTHVLKKKRRKGKNKRREREREGGSRERWELKINRDLHK